MLSNRQQKRLGQLDNLCESEVKIMFRDGNAIEGYIYGVRTDLKEPSLSYTTRAPSVDDVDHSSMVNPMDLLPSAQLNQLGYVQVQSTGKKINLLTFR